MMQSRTPFATLSSPVGIYCMHTSIKVTFVEISDLEGKGRRGREGEGGERKGREKGRGKG